MKCSICKGACCETVSIRKSDMHLPDLAAWEWLFARANDGALESPLIELESTCPHLVEGGCDLHETLLKPRVCIEMEVGGVDCLTYVRKRRTPAQYQEIREATDPKELGCHDDWGIDR